MSHIRSWNAAEDGPNPLSIATAKPPRPIPQPKPSPVIDREWVNVRLEQAGATLLALRMSSPSPMGYRGYWPEFLRHAIEAYGYHNVRIRPAIPDAKSISQMDRTMEWLNLIPQDRYVLRRIVGARALVSPITRNHLYSWSKLAQMLGCDRRAVTRWHEQGIAMIADELRKRPGHDD